MYPEHRIHSEQSIHSGFMACQCFVILWIKRQKVPWDNWTISYFRLQCVFWSQTPASSSQLPLLSVFPLSAPCTATWGFVVDPPLLLWRCSFFVCLQVQSWVWEPCSPLLWGCWSPVWRYSSSAPCAWVTGWFSWALGLGYTLLFQHWNSYVEAPISELEGWLGGLLHFWRPEWPASFGSVWGGCPLFLGWWSAALWPAAAEESLELHSDVCPHWEDCQDTPETKPAASIKHHSS